MDPFISYAQNFEDVMLWRALKHIQHGFYVDVGANDPKIDSVTLAFYQRGWRGINIEPMPSYYAALCLERPEDINLPFAVGASDGELTLYEVHETGISSVIPTSVFDNKYLAGREVLERKVPATTLDKIFDQYVKDEIHFLKIDVEGYEKAVMEGLNLTKWRPWILVMEATLPNSSVINEEFPESIIISSGYTFVYFDGLNKFYLAHEHLDLRDAFSTPPNVFDYFSLYRQEKANEEIEALRMELDWARNGLNQLRDERDRARKSLDQLREERDWSRKSLDQLMEERDWARKSLDQLREERDRARKRLDQLREERDWSRKSLDQLREERDWTHVAREELIQVHAELASKQAEAEELKRQYINILYSFSFRVTAPLRFVYSQVYSIRNWLRNVSYNFSKGNRLPHAKKVFIVDTTELTEDEQYFFGFFQREFNRRKKNRMD